MIPARLTVARDALFRFSGSKTAFMVSVILILSPLARVRTLLSSSTVFRFSIQMASTGPSNTIHVFWPLLLEALLQSTAKTPSVQSPDEVSSLPNI